MIVLPSITIRSPFIIAETTPTPGTDVTLPVLGTVIVCPLISQRSCPLVSPKGDTVIVAFASVRTVPGRS